MTFVPAQYRCDSCRATKPNVGGPPAPPHWYALTSPIQGPHALHFCSLTCLQKWGRGGTAPSPAWRALLREARSVIAPTAAFHLGLQRAVHELNDEPRT